MAQYASKHVADMIMMMIIIIIIIHVFYCICALVGVVKIQ